MEYTTKLWIVEAEMILDMTNDRIKDIESGELVVESKQDDLDTLRDIRTKMIELIAKH